MNHSRTTLHVYPRRSRFSGPTGIRAAVSLHGHSACSRESLTFVPELARHSRLLSKLVERALACYQRENGRPLDFSEWYWRPPLAPQDVIASEREHLNRRLGLHGFVSLTDHDTLDGPRALRANGCHDVPLSVEWTVPFGRSVFHVGVHAIRSAQVDQIADALGAYTRHPSSVPPGRLAEILDWLGESPETLVVLNHPYWDLGGVGQMRHDSNLLAFLLAHRDRIHALELNGYRTWTENRRVLPLADGFGIPVVGGGDRHGFTPNAIVNLTRASGFAEFVREVRVERRTDCVVFPEYAEPFAARLLRSADDVLRPERRRGGTLNWPDRIFTVAAGGEQPVSALWSRAPLWLDMVVGITRLLGTRPLAAVFRVGRSDGRQLLAGDCGAELGDALRLAHDSIAAA